MEEDAARAASSGVNPCAINEPIIPVRTSPLPPLASAGPPVMLTQSEDDGERRPESLDVITVPSPLEHDVTPVSLANNCAIASGRPAPPGCSCLSDVPSRPGAGNNDSAVRRANSSARPASAFRPSASITIGRDTFQ